MAKRARDCTEARLRELLDAEKDAHGQTPTWTRASARDGSLILARLCFHVSALGEDLVVLAEWKGPGDQQVMLMFPHDNARLLRLCLTSCHNGQVHWHELEQCKGVEPREIPVPNPPAGERAIEPMLDMLVAVMKIKNLNLQGTLE